MHLAAAAIRPALASALPHQPQVDAQKHGAVDVGVALADRPPARGRDGVAIGERRAVERNRPDQGRIASLRRAIGRDLHQRDVVRIHVGRARKVLAAGVVLRMPDDPLDAVDDAVARRDVLRAETHLEAQRHFRLVDAMGGRQHPIVGDQHAAAVMLPNPFGVRRLRIRGAIRVEDLRLPRHGAGRHRTTTEGVGHILARRRGTRGRTAA